MLINHISSLKLRFISTDEDEQMLKDREFEDLFTKFVIMPFGDRLNPDLVEMAKEELELSDFLLSRIRIQREPQ